MKKNKEQNVIVEEKSATKVCKKCGDPLRSIVKTVVENEQRQDVKLQAQ